MPKTQIILSEEFVQNLSVIYSKKVLQRIKNIINLLQKNPELGSPIIRESLVKTYGDNLRKIPVSKFVIIYRCKNNTVQILALVYGPAVV